MKLNYKDPIYWLGILALGFFLWGQCNSNKADRLAAEIEKSNWQQKVKTLESAAAISRAKSEALEQARKKYTDSARTQQKARIKEIQGFKATIAKLKLTVLPQIDTNTDLSHLISTQDLVIRKQDSLIDSLQLAHSAEIINLTEQLAEKGREIMKEAQQTEAWRVEAVDARADEKKERRRKGFFKVTTSILVGAVVFLSLQK